MPTNTRREIEFTIGGIGPNIVMPNPWGWPQIQQLLGEVFLSSDNRHTSVSNIGWQEMALQLYGFLPQAKTELRRIQANGKRYFRDAAAGRPEAREILRPYRQQLRALVWAARMKLGTIHCRPNQQDWHQRAYGFFLALQNNLSHLRRVHFLTITFPDPISYDLVRDSLRGVTRNLLFRAGMESVDVIAFHPREGSPGRLHVHMLVWSKEPRTPQAETAAMRGVLAGLRAGRYGVGRVELERLTSRQSFMRTAAYMALNYDRTLKLSKGDHNPIPQRARLLRVPQEVHPGVRWTKTGKFSFVTTARTAWRAAIGRYAAAVGHSAVGNWQWTWRERRRIREYLEPERWRPPSVTGLDGYTYQVIPYGEDAVGNETYLLSNEERGGFVLTEYGLEVVGEFEVLCGTLPKNDRLDLTTGEHACWFEVWGLPFTSWRTRGNSQSRHRSRPRLRA
ncbi:MAG: hypothetical protein PHC88_04210 [Terrimicrobiaceae bacterium]|nr:hypothetical protein [Terrimicrobiaceae bacterium]